MSFINKILSISTERRVFDKSSPIRERFISYGKLFDETHMIIFTEKSHEKDFNILKQKIDGNLFLYPTKSKNRWHYIFDAVKIGKQIIRERNLNKENSYITTQDVFETGLVGFWLRLKSKIKLHVQIHTDIFTEHFVKGHLLNGLRIIISQFIIPSADKIRVVSEGLKEKIIESYKVDENKIDILPVLVDKGKILNSPIDVDLHKKYPQFETIFLMVSRLEKEKNIVTAIESFSKISRDKKAGLIIVGDGKWEGILKKLVKYSKLEDKIIFEKWNNNIYSYYKTGDALISTSFYEGYGMIFIEAVLCGCPIISSRVGIIKEKFTDNENALICEADNKRCFTKKIEEIINSLELRKKLSENAIELIEKENILMSKEEYLQKYKNQFNF